jgi:hypothetical protein
MKKYATLCDQMATRIRRKKALVFLRADFADLGSYKQVGRVLRAFVEQGKLIKIGYGLYAKAKSSALIGEIVPAAPLPTLAIEALARLGIETAPSRLEQAYQAGQTRQVPTGRLIAVKGRIRRKIGFGGAFIYFEAAP